MSEIKVNKISPKQTCTQLTLGDSGDTIIVTSGANLNTDAIKNLNSSSIITQTNTTTITLGYSGSTIAIASGATQTGFGRTGTVDWDTTAKTTGFTAVSGVGYFVDTTSAAITVNLPASPSAGAIVGITDYAGTAATNNITIAGNGSKIEGASANAFISTNRDSITLVYVDSTQGWLPVYDNAGSNLSPFIIATGGTVTTCGNCKIHTFTGPGNFVVSNAGNPTGSNTVNYLVVAGGAGTGGGNRNGGGGAGGFRQNYPSPSTTGIPVSITTYPITVGGGGGASSAGSPSIFSTITSAGGGPEITPGGSGGGASGGGPAGSGNTPPVSPSQGNPGGATAGGCAPGAGGGGGAGSPGNNASGPRPAGPGGSGTATSITGTSVTYAGGGGGGIFGSGTVGSGGPGGGGAGAPTGSPGGNGTANTGGGGGGGSFPGQPGGLGGSGIVVIRYKYQ